MDQLSILNEATPLASTELGAESKRNILLFDDTEEEHYEIGETYTLNLQIDYEIMFKEGTGFGIYSAFTPDTGYPISIKGTFLNPLEVGRVYTVKGVMNQYRNDFQIESDICYEAEPTSKIGIIGYLQTLYNLKEVKAEAIYKVFGANSISILKTDPLQVSQKISGIGEKSVFEWQKQLIAKAQMQDILVHLFELGLNAKEAKKLYEKFGAETLVIVQSNPYVLINTAGFDFQTCDKIAFNLGERIQKPERIQEGIIYVLSKATQKGHCYLTLEELESQVKEVLSLKLSVSEMKHYVNLYKGQSNFVHTVGKFNFTINYADLIKAYRQWQSAYHYSDKRGALLTFSTVDDIASHLIPLKQQQRVAVKTIMYNDVLQTYVYLRTIYDCEYQLASDLLEIRNAEIPLNFDVEGYLNESCKKNHVELEGKQYQGIISSTKGRGGVHIIIGSAGTGKTFCQQLILQTCNEVYKSCFKRAANILLVAPTGKAAKVCRRRTGHECMTIHRALAYDPEIKGFTFNRNNKLEVDVVILDEATMADLEIMHALVEALPITTKIIIQGDIKQLPSVGAGNVLADLLKSNCFDVTELNVVKRQAENSGIVNCAHQIIAGEMINSTPQKDVFVMIKESPEQIIRAIIKSYSRMLELYDSSEVQLLLPQRKGPIGTHYLNYILQQQFNSQEDKNQVLSVKDTVNIGGSSITYELYFKTGDKVIHIKNDYSALWYEKANENDLSKETKLSDDEDIDGMPGYSVLEYMVGITNGEVGIIEEIRQTYKYNPKTQNQEMLKEIIVKYDEGYVIYDYREDGALSQLEHAYALTIHKSQGSEWKAVILPICRAHASILLTNNLFYTGFTRGKELIAQIGDYNAIFNCIKTFRLDKRNTTLSAQLIDKSN